MKLKIFDTTLRDGSQAEGVTYSAHDKFRISLALDGLGMHYIEGGWPGSNPKDIQFFKDAKKHHYKSARITAFGSTRRKNTPVAQDPNLKAILDAQTPVACIFGKTWDLHVTHALQTTLDENLAMIRDTVKYLKSKKREVIYDAEHFFDGYRANPYYAMQTLHAAVAAGADNLTLCDTNGGCLPGRITEGVRAVRREFPSVELGIHAHNDSGCAVANTLAAVDAGCVLVQGTMNGIGERCGNADLTVVLPNLQLKMGFKVMTDAQLHALTETSRLIAELANLAPNDRQPYVGNSAFAHKGGIHVSAVARLASTYEHIKPELVGNKHRILISELSGKSNVLLKGEEMKKAWAKDDAAGKAILAAVKKKEAEGYHFEGAEASFELLVQKALGHYKPYFDLVSYHVVVEKDPSRPLACEVTVKIKVNGKEQHTVAEGDGPVNALDNGLRKALEKFYPVLTDMSLMDYKVRVVNAAAGTAAMVRVMIESRDKQGHEWATMGVSTNVIDASWLALVDALEYKLLKYSNSRAKRRGK